jgi:hypothetical protein
MEVLSLNPLIVEDRLDHHFQQGKARIAPMYLKYLQEMYYLPVGHVNKYTETDYAMLIPIALLGA